MNLKVAIYARVSTDRQSEMSIEAQHEFCKDYARREGWDIYGFYSDYGTSATDTARRPQMLQLIADAKKGKFDLVLAHKVDRAFRNARDYENVKYTLEKEGVTLGFVETGFNTDNQNIFVNGLMSLMAQYYSQNLSVETKKTMKRNVEKGIFLGGVPPFGFKIVDRKYTIDPVTGEHARRVFEMYAYDGASFQDLADYLNDLGFETTRHRPFKKSYFSEMLRNEKYNGVYVHNQHSFSTLGKRGGKKQNEEKEVIRVENVIPKIVDDRTFSAVQKRLGNNKAENARKGAKRVYMLSGLCYCGICGAPMSGDYKGLNKAGNPSIYYTCGNRKAMGADKCGCSLSSVNKNVLEDVVIGAIHKLIYLQDSTTIRKEVSKQIAAAKKEEKKLQKALAAQRLKIQRAQKNIINTIEKHGGGEILLKRLKENEKKIKEIDEELEFVKQEKVTVTTAHVMSAIKIFIDRFNASSDKDKKKVLNKLINKVVVNQHSIYIYLQGYSTVLEKEKEGKNEPLKLFLPSDNSPDTASGLVAEVRNSFARPFLFAPIIIDRVKTGI